MKQETAKVKKQRQPATGKATRSACGTLSYLAECRGALHKIGPTQGAAPPDGVNRIVRQ